MTQKDKELLLKDLCARLPYGVICKVHLDTKGYCLRDEDKYCDDTLESVNCRKQTCTFNKSIGYDFGNFAIEDVKPYLRPLSSMTEEEKIQYQVICESWMNSLRHYDVDWLIEHHFDYRGLIEKSLALEALEGMYN